MSCYGVGIDQQGNPVDSEFEFAQGIFAKKISDEFKIRERTIPEGVPIKIYPKAIHQFWKGINEWPVVQIGPGILAINETEVNYEWKSRFYPLIKKGIQYLEESYEQELIYKNVSLRYLDAVEIDSDERHELLKYINSKFNLELINKFKPPGRLSNSNLTQTFTVDRDTKVSLIISDGINKSNKPAIVWQTHIITNTKKLKEEVIEWVEGAHQVTSDTFLNVLNKDFYDSFK